jgi:ATPase subunit of ABC transporter with duplicated ATPase domains
VPAGRNLFVGEQLRVRLGDKDVFTHQGIDLIIRGPERIALTGANGAGKSTLLRLLNGDLTPQSGEIKRAGGRIAYLSQRLDLLDEQRTVLENLMSWAPTLSVTRRRHLLAQFLFQDNRIDLPVSVLSGGERLRATLACVLYAEPAPHLLLLDEPTNNLDLVSVGQLESALNAYRGAFIVVSHDERFLDAIGIERRMMLE